MYIKVLDGRHAGKVRDIDNGTALELLAIGRATKAFGETAQPRPQAAPSTVQVAPTASTPAAAGIAAAIAVVAARARRAAAR